MLLHRIPLEILIFMSFDTCTNKEVVNAFLFWQMNLLLHGFLALENQVNSSSGDISLNKMETSEEICEWLAVLWERGFCHDNPHGV